MNAPSFSASPPRDATEQAIVQWAQAQPAVRAALLTSTRAVADAALDELSDYDLILVVGDLSPFAADRTWLDDFGEVLVAYWDPLQPHPTYGLEQLSNVVQYASGLKVDFTLWSVALLRQIAAAPDLPAELDAGYRVLLDKDLLTNRLKPPSGRAYVPAKPSLEAYQTLVNDFWSDAPYVAKCLWRGELLPAKWCLDCDMKHVYLLRLLEWRAQLDHAWAQPVGWLGKGLRKLLPPDLWQRLEACFAGADLAENWEALANTLALFRQVAVEVGAALGYPYPHELDRRVCASVERLKNLPARPR
jgi:aminoglycoside 6-adenylyltransferase